MDLLQDTNFWDHLEYLASDWLAASPEKELRRFWIDGFLPSTLRRTNAGAEIEGEVWVAAGPCDQVKFAFLAVVPWRIVNRGGENIEIEQIAIDPNRKALRMVIRRAREAKAPPSPRPAG